MVGTLILLLITWAIVAAVAVALTGRRASVRPSPGGPAPGASREAVDVTDSGTEGGSADNPIRVDSPAVVEVRATRSVCPVCDRFMTIDRDQVSGSTGQRIVTVECRPCGCFATLYFQVGPLKQ